MRTKIVAGNWKMNLLLPEAMNLIDEISGYMHKPLSTEVFCFVPYPYLSEASARRGSTELCIGAQNCSAFVSGAYTGEVSAPMIASCGASAVIIGHSERRHVFAEAHVEINLKIQRAAEELLVPVWCCGETLNERKEGHHFSVIQSQFELELSELKAESFKNLVIAYEPVWAIGTGLTASTIQVQEMHAFVRSLVKQYFGENQSMKTRILYGGSCNASNAKDLFALPDVDGGLVGGASLKSEEFIKIIEAANLS